MDDVAAGWYPSPDNSGQLRWWDGHYWTGHTAARVANPPPRRRGSASLWGAALITVIVIVTAGASVLLLTKDRMSDRELGAARACETNAFITASPYSAGAPTTSRADDAEVTGTYPRHLVRGSVETVAADGALGLADYRCVVVGDDEGEGRSWVVKDIDVIPRQR